MKKRVLEGVEWERVCSKATRRAFCGGGSGVAGWFELRGEDLRICVVFLDS